MSYIIKSIPLVRNLSTNQYATQHRQKDYTREARYIEELRNAELINKKLLMHKKELLPELCASYTNKNMNSLASAYQLSDYSPVRRYQRPQHLDKQQKIFYNQAEINASQQQKKGPKGKNSTEPSVHSKIGKSYSEVKRMSHLQQLSTQALLAIKRSQYAGKVLTEESAASNSSKQIYQRLNQLKNKDRLISIQHTQQSPEKDQLKQYKHSSFVLKFKVAQSHQIEKQQLKGLKNSRNDNSINNLRDNIKIKNYIKFFSNEIQHQI